MTPRQASLNLLLKIFACFAWRRSPWLAAALFVAPDLYLLAGLLVPWSTLLGPVFTHFAPSFDGAREVWLTIDDGPDPEDTPRILDALDRHGARATFFLIGRRAERHPELVREILRRGHAAAHHTYSHPAASFWCASPARVRREIDRGLAALARGGARPAVFRPAVGIRSLFLRRALARSRLICVNWSIRSGDCFGRSGGTVVDRVLRRVRPGAIILMHEGPSVRAGFRVRLIERVLERLAAGGYACVIPPLQSLRMGRLGDERA